MTTLLQRLAGNDAVKTAFLLLLLLSTMAYLLQASALGDAMQYQRSSFTTQPWQGISHALVHLNLRHLSLNALALLCIVALFPDAFRSTGWLLALLASAMISALGLYLFSPLTAWCVGLSGALHGLMIYAVLRSHASIAWLLALVAKIGLEQTQLFQQSGWLSATAEYIGHDVVVDAHLWGAIGGFLFYLAVHAFNYLRVSIEIQRSRS